MTDGAKEKLQLLAIALLGGSLLIGTLFATIGGGVILSRIGQ